MLLCRDFPELRHSESGGIRLLQGTCQPCRGTAAHATVIGIACKRLQHGGNQFIHLELLSGQCFLYLYNLARDRFREFTVIGP